jgi:hypothetical protein
MIGIMIMTIITSLHYLMINIMIIIILLIILFIAYRRNTGSININPKHVRILLRTSARYAIAASQDNNVAVAVLHANYAAGYLWALSDIATTSEIESISGINWKQFRNAIIDIQDMATKRLSKACPNYINLSKNGNIQYLARVAGDV